MGAYEEEEPGVFQKYRLLIGGGLVAILAIAVGFGLSRFHPTARPRREQNIVMVNLPPPPPLPPPPRPRIESPPPSTESEPKMITQEPVNENESKPTEETKGAAPASEAPALGTSIQGSGSSGEFGLSGGDSFGGGTGKTTKHGSSSRWGWYASEVQSAITRALQSNDNTRTADFRVVVQVWSDRNGRITRAHLTGSTGTVALDDAITNQVLAGLILQESPPDGMPMPIVLRLTARHSQTALSRQ